MNSSAMSGTQQEIKNTINLKGSASLITDFMNYGINMILFQREVYAMESFEKTERYGRPIFLTTDEKLKRYLDGVLNGLRTLLENDECRRVDLVIISVADEEPVERWEFDIEPTHEVSGDGLENVDPSNKSRTSSKDIKEIQQQIMKIMRQIIATVSMLPNYEQEITFNILLHTKKKAKSEMRNWSEADARVTSLAGERPGEEDGVEVLRFDSLKTGVHSVHSKVCYKVGIG